ncbi:hypothetical protein FQR65_LT03241 [Abscondita terminalis]|nr:hypothetical protein FQR65_LT03241 [Abscondita terminalis]
MALSILLRNTSRIQSCTLLSRCLNKNVTTLSCISNTFAFNNADKLLSSKNSISVLPAVRHMASVDHRGMWKFERILSAGLLALLPACIAYPSEILDNLTAVAIVAHFHWGLVAIVQDYLRPVVVGKIIPPIALALAYMVTVTTLAGLLFFNYTDIGIGEFVRQVWRIKE